MPKRRTQVMDISAFTLILFTLFGSLRIVSYIPQILRVAADKHGAAVISYTTWSLWTGSNASTALYAAVNLNDPYLAVISWVNAACCTIVIVLTFLKRRLLPAQPKPLYDPMEIDRVAMARWL